jgi:hypothetical protein
LGRDPNEKIADLDRFGGAQIGTGGKAHQRHAVLDANRAIAHAFDGQKPLAGSRPLDPSTFGAKTSSSRTPTVERSRDRD